jgi:hypothetical protein
MCGWGRGGGGPHQLVVHSPSMQTFPPSMACLFPQGHHLFAANLRNMGAPLYADYGCLMKPGTVATVRHRHLHELACLADPAQLVTSFSADAVIALMQVSALIQ